WHGECRCRESPSRVAVRAVCAVCAVVARSTRDLNYFRCASLIRATSKTWKCGTHARYLLFPLISGKQCIRRQTFFGLCPTDNSDETVLPPCFEQLIVIRLVEIQIRDPVLETDQ